MFDIFLGWMYTCIMRAQTPKKPKNLEWLKYVALQKLMKSRKVTPSGCWEWTGKRNSDGYGFMRFDGKVWTVSRLSNYLFKPMFFREHLPTLHTCDNPACFNPEHLNSGTHRQNQIDWLTRGQYRKAS